METITGCNAINEHVNTPIPNTLWHYTSCAGFQGIVTSKCIWASEYRFLNDRQEFLHAKQLAYELAGNEPEYVGQQFPAREYLRKAIDIAFNTGYLHEDRLRVMVASFSEEGDQLSQWKGYADDSRGVSLGLNLREIRPPSSIGTSVVFAPCLYKDQEKRALLQGAFAHYKNGLLQWWESLCDAAVRKRGEGAPYDPQFATKLVSERRQELNDIVNRYHVELQFDLLRAAPLLKDDSFSEEREWRLVLPLQGLPKQRTLQFRSVRDTLIPYIAYPLSGRDHNGSAPCNELVLGSGCHPSAEIGINLFLQSERVKVLARRSRIPYRPA